MGQWHAVLNKSAEHDLKKIDRTERTRFIKDDKDVFLFYMVGSHSGRVYIRKYVVWQSGV